MTDLRSRGILVAFCLVALLLTAPLAGQDLPTAKPEDVGVSSAKVEELSKFMQSLVDQGKIAGGVTMMARHGKVIHLKAVGMTDREEKTPMRTDAIFRIASMSKAVTSVAVMMLHDQGKLSLDDPVSKYIPEFQNPKVLVSVDPLKTEPAKREITIRHLLTHTSGLGYPFSDKIGPLYFAHRILSGCCSTEETLEQVTKRLAKEPLLFHPGERWEYSMASDVLGRVVEVVSGLTLDRFIEDQICRPLGMEDTFFKVPAEKLPRLVPAYMPLGDSIRKVLEGERFRNGLDLISSDYPYVESNKYLSGGGGLCSTPRDFMVFCQMLLNKGQLNGVRLLRKDTVEMMMINQIGDLPAGILASKFGLGFGVTPDTDGVHDHLKCSYTWGGSWVTSFPVSPRGDWIVITMAQRDWTNDAHPLWFAKYESIAAESILD